MRMTIVSRLAVMMDSVGVDGREYRHIAMNRRKSGSLTTRRGRLVVDGTIDSINESSAIGSMFVH